MEDGIEALLNQDDPVERKLALKSNKIEPYHLRLALQDEDSDVRLAAALHPAMTPELLKEVLTGPDKWLAEQTLRRPDLRPEELEHVMGDEDLMPTAATHPALSDDQRQRLLDHPDVQDGLKEHVAQGLIKNIGYITYPELGEGTVHSGPKIIDHEADGAKSKQVGGTRYSSRRSTATPGQNRVLNSWVTTHSDHALHALEGHEGQHVVFSRLKQRFGREATYRTIAKTFAGLDHTHREHVYKVLDAARSPYTDMQRPEEALAHLHNYLQDPDFRRKVHVNMRISRDIYSMRDSVLKARKAWKMLQDEAKKIKPEDVGVDYKKSEEQIPEWIQGLKKSVEYDPEHLADHLGLDVNLNSYLGAATFLGHPLDMEAVRMHMYENDGDIKETILQLAGLTSKEERESFENVIQLQSLTKGQTNVPDIQAATPDGEDLAEAIRWAYQNEEVEDVHLGGKHSKGTVLARDKDGNLVLLKPANGKLSPAAGVREEKASQSAREAAFYHIAKAIGLTSTVPRAELLIIDSVPVAAIEMLGLNWQNLGRAKLVNPNIARMALKPYLDKGIIFKWAVLDYFTGNPDRHFNNAMIAPESKEHKLALIDAGSAFAGPSFDPGADNSSFIPFYLRAWGPDKGFMQLSREDKLHTMPSLHETMDSELREWIAKIDPKALEQIMARYGINPKPSLKRLEMIQRLAKTATSCSEMMNQLWIE